MVVGLAVVGSVSLASPAQADTGGYPYASVGGLGTDSTDSTWYDSNGRDYSQYGYDYRNCTDFVAWKLSEANGFSLPGGIGNAAAWGTWAGGSDHTDYTVNGTPDVGAVAWWASGTEDSGYSVGGFGHVAWVSAVGTGSNPPVTIEEYNQIVSGGLYDGAYHTRTITYNATTEQVQYIHFADVTSTTSWQASATPPMKEASSRQTKRCQITSIWSRQTGNSYSSYSLMGIWLNILVAAIFGQLVLVAIQGIISLLVVMENIVLYSSTNHALWDTTPQGNTKLVMQNDGNVVAYDSSGTAHWNDGKSGGASLASLGTTSLTTNQELTNGEYIQSSDGRYTALLQSDGNFVMYGPGYHVLWNSGTYGHSGDSLIVGGDGNIVIYSSSNSALWDTTPQGDVELVMQSDGNLVAYTSSDQAEFNTGTAGLT